MATTILIERMIAERKLQNLSQEKLGEKAKVSRNTVIRWESAESDPDVLNFARWCHALGISTDEAINWQEVLGE